MTLLVSVAASATVSIRGVVVDPDGVPIPGATVKALIDSDRSIQTAADAAGLFHLRVGVPGTAVVPLRVSSVGYSPRDIDVKGLDTASPLRVILQPDLVEVAGITVTSTATLPTSDRTFGADEVIDLGRRSLVPSNPVAALQTPQISRVGSNHSSQLRVHGTNPVYLLNGLPIGTDPDHFGVFSIIPSPVVRSLDFHPMGTSAPFLQSSAVEIHTPAPYDERPGGELMMSTIDITASGHAGNSRFFAMGAVRKSVLDHLVKSFEISTDRATLPPTNFQDVFVAAGVRLTPTWQLEIDRYNVRDFLSYNTSQAVSTAGNIDTYQESSEDLAAIRSEFLKSNIAMRTSVALKRQIKKYRATPGDESPASTVSADISENSRTLILSHDATWYRTGLDISAGVLCNGDLKRAYHLSHTNWNFQPPFAATDNPYVYQEALNDTYGVLSGEAASGTTSMYVSTVRYHGPWRIESGLRYDRFSRLTNGHHLNYRLRAALQFDDRTTVSLFHGIFAQSPIDNILEAYQVLVRAHLDELTPVTTSVWSLGLLHSPVTLNLFHKRIEQLPVTGPDFAHLYDQSGSYGDGFITVRSAGQASFDGLSISVGQDGLLGGRLDLETSYAYTHGDRITDGITIPYDLTAPHRFFGRAAYVFNPRFRMAAEGQVRSGYPFTPLRRYPVGDNTRYFTDEYYRSTLAEENSLRFALNAYLNLSATYTTGNAEIYLTLANLTNRANPIISTAGGIVYDTGILPMVGINYRF